MSYKKVLLLFFVHCVLCFAQAQLVTVPYQFGFEKGDPEINNWKLNFGSRGEYCEDQWVVGNLEYNEGYQSLYISSNEGLSATYGSQPNVVVVYRTLELPAGNYDVSFDWKNSGYATISDLFVCLLPDGYSIGDEILESNDTIGYFPKVFSRFCMPLTTIEGTFMSLSDKNTWCNASFQTSVAAGRKLQLAFVWVNFNQDTTIANPLGACIDNIQITSAMCPKPENLRADASCGTINFSWNGFAPIYECGYKLLGSKYWNNVYDIDGEVDNPSFSFEDMPEGAYDLRVRAIDNGDTSAYVYLNTVVVWCPDNHCFDFVSLDNKDIVTCEIGSAIFDPLGNPGEYKFYTANPSPSIGGNDVNARHIACWVQGMYDPNTGNKLLMVPPDEIASVRLGNQNAGSQAERITYEFDVQEDLVLLMKYAVVLENPGHDLTGGGGDPYFGLQILKEDGTPIDSEAACGEAFFKPTQNPDDWKHHRPSLGVDFVWKDWTTIGIDLRQYKGQKVKIQLTTQDCTLGKHSGYAYFTLDCISATISSEGCDTVSLEAPSGFKYYWYNNENKDFKPSNNQSIDVLAGDTTTYYCKVTYLDKTDCNFVLSSSVIPHFPKAKFNALWQPANCNNNLKFDNESYVYVKIDDTDSIVPGKRCAHYEWEFEFDGKVTRTDLASPRYVMPNEGGQLKVRLSAFLEDEQCLDVLDTIINVPEIHGHNLELTKEICWGDYVILGDNFAMESGTYVDTALNIWGCDSITTLYLTVRPKLDDVIVYDTLCSIDPYIIGNYKLDSTGIYEIKLETSDSLKCDSIVILHLEKMSPLAADIKDEYRSVCADDAFLSVEYDLVEGARNPFMYSLVFDSLAHMAGFVDVYDIEVDPDNQIFEIALPNNCRPNSYEVNILLKDTISTCGDVVMTVKFDVYYSSSILETKFGNLIAVLATELNGGYEFDEYKWFRDGILIPNEDKAFYYLDGGTFGSECYYLEVKRKDDGVVMRTCEICPGDGTPVDNIYSSVPYVVNTIVKAGEAIVIANVNQAVVNLYTITGQLVETQHIEYDGDAIDMVVLPGVYLLQVSTSTEIFTTKIIITE